MAQVPGDTLFMRFDATGETLSMDSIYPSGCWQVGAPQKGVFTSAWSPPNALVTDTLLPHVDSTTCYAEFTLVAAWPDVGRSLSFRQRLDLDQDFSYGTIEAFSGSLGAWHDLSQHPELVTSFEGLDYGPMSDSLLSFTGVSNGWELVQLYFGCLKFYPYPPETLRLRFVFHAGANLAGRDGWMIDDVAVTAATCYGAVDEHGQPTAMISPNPAGDLVMLELTSAPLGPMTLELFRADGALLRRERLKGARHTLDLAALPDGPYVIRIIGGHGQLVDRLVIQR